jgi:hypothetical protein
MAENHSLTFTFSWNMRFKKKLRGLVRQGTIPTERPPLVGKVNANFSG